MNHSVLRHFNGIELMLMSSVPLVLFLLWLVKMFAVPNIYRSNVSLWFIVIALICFWLFTIPLIILWPLRFNLRTLWGVPSLRLGTTDLQSDQSINCIFTLPHLCSLKPISHTHSFGLMTISLMSLLSSVSSMLLWLNRRKRSCRNNARWESQSRCWNDPLSCWIIAPTPLHLPPPVA